MEVDLSNYRATPKRKHGHVTGVGGHYNASCDASSLIGPADPSAVPHSIAKSISGTSVISRVFCGVQPEGNRRR